MNYARAIVLLLVVVSVGICAAAAEPDWNPADAAKEAEQDIRSGHIKFYWAGSIAYGPVGVPMSLAQKYPKADAGSGCVVKDQAELTFRERQQEYARRYNQIILDHLKSTQKSGKSSPHETPAKAADQQRQRGADMFKPLNDKAAKPRPHATISVRE